MEASDSFDLPRYNVNSAAHASYPMYNQESAGVARGHHRLSSLLSGEQSPTPAGTDSSIHRSNSLSSSFYPPALAPYRQDSNQQLHPYQNNELYPNQEYGGSYAPRRANTTTSKGVTLSPRSSLRQQSPAISVTMEPSVSSSTYPQQHPSGVSYAPAVSGGNGDSYSTAPTQVDSSTQYHNHSDAPSPTPSANGYPPPYTSPYASQPPLYPTHQQQHIPPPQQSQDAYSNHSHYSQQPPQEVSRSSSSAMHHSSSVRASASTPNTPLSHGRTYQTQPPIPSSQQPGYYQPIDPPAQRRRLAGLRRVRDPRDLRPMLNPQPAGRRVDPNGTGFLSPLKSLTTHISSTYNICNPQFHYEVSHNPRRVLTKPSKPVHNEGFDNEDYDYILYVNDWLGTEDGHNKYLILDILGQGTFGQVVKCQNMKTHEIVAVKVVKNKPAYFNQSMMEVQILKMLNDECDAHDEHHILRLRETFIHKNHLCLVFELLSSNLYELIKQNQFGGLSTQLVKVFTAQLLDALTVLKEASLIHCDLKPENILLKSLQAPTIKVIDFGSACHERQTVYTYIQSRFYRSPEVLLGLPYNSAIDMWSLGCIAVELFLGLPLFPGTSEYNQITRIVEMLGMPPTWMLEKGKQAANFFTVYEEYGQKHYRLKSLEQYSREHGTNEQPGKKYFQYNTLPEIIKNAPIQKSSSKTHADIEKEMQHRASFIDFVSGLLNLNPFERWLPQQARLHPFITGEKFTKPFVPSVVTVNGTITRTASTALPGADSQGLVAVGSANPDAAQSAKRPYGGLVPQAPKGTRPYHDAVAYNQRLVQHQVHMAQHAAQAATSAAFKNPYIAAAAASAGQQPQQPSASSGYAYAQGPGNGVGQPPPTGQYNSRPKDHLPLDPYVGQSSQQQQRLQPLSSVLPSTTYSGPLSAQQNPNPPSSSYYPSNRARANTINQMDQVPPQLARVHLDLESAGMGRNTLTPVINREDAMREWERRQAGGGKVGGGPAYPHLEYLQQQVEMDPMGAIGGRWGSMGHGGVGTHRYAPTQPSSLQFQSPPAAVVVDNQDKSANLREAAISSARTAAGLGGGAVSGRYDHVGNANVPAPPQPAYSTGNPMMRYGTTGNGTGSTSYGTQQPQPVPPSYDSYDHRDGLATMYVPMQPNQYGNFPSNAAQGQGTNHTPTSLGAQGVPAAAPSFYSAGVVAAGGPQTFGNQQQQQQSQQSKDARRLSGMDMWSR
ncbi:dual specificity protein kinase yak1 [Tulasnella sp. 403]|nr:dual specificity protein kinase yak1 [Tulasnella sp. 403]